MLYHHFSLFLLGNKLARNKTIGEYNNFLDRLIGNPWKVLIKIQNI